jgi:hypothetical protein
MPPPRPQPPPQGGRERYFRFRYSSTDFIALSLGAAVRASTTPRSRRLALVATSAHPIATPPPIVRFNTWVVFSIRSAAALSAFATAA